jgi:hypothetical protein
MEAEGRQARFRSRRDENTTHLASPGGEEPAAVLMDVGHVLGSVVASLQSATS